MRKRHNQRKIAAIACLVALLLLQAPFASAAWFSSSMACCMGDHCPIPSHHHKSAANTEKPMDCDHNMGKMADCKISRCRTSDETAINIAQFVIPVAQVVPSLETKVPSIFQIAPQTLSRSEKPQSPPPRTNLS